MQKLLIALFLAIFALPVAVSAQPVSRSGYEIAWFDEFDTGPLNNDLWTAADVCTFKVVTGGSTGWRCPTTSAVCFFVLMVKSG